MRENLESFAGLRRHAGNELEVRTDSPWSLTWACCCLLLLLLAFAQPAAAAESADSEKTASQPEQAAKVEVLRDQFALTPAEAEASLAAQERGTKVDIVGQLREQMGKDFAGVWFDNETGEFVVPLVAGTSDGVAARDRAAVTSEFAAAALPAAYRIEVAEFSQAELEAAQEALDEELAPFFEARLVQTAIDPSRNAVVVRVPASAKGERLAAIRKVAGQSSVPVVFDRLPDSAFVRGPAGCIGSEQKCDLPLRSGQVIYGPSFEKPGKPGQLYNEICTAAFRANGSDGKKYVLTAGHCMFRNSTLGEPINWDWFTQSPNEPGNNSIGTANQWHYDGKDWAKIDATGSWADTPPWPTIAAYWGTGNFEYPITGEATSYKGQTLCHLGANTGSSCGIVVAQNVTVEYFDGAKINSMFEVHGKDLALGGGDSGGPVIASNVALGIVSGGTDAYSYAELLFSDIVAANAELGTNVVGPGAPESITGVPTSVGGYQATVGGQVNPHGLATTYKFEYGQGAYSKSTFDYSAGSGQGFTSISTVLPFLEPNATYKYRIKAWNSLNTSVGKEGAFTTPPAPPIISNQSASNITNTSVTVGGLISPEGSATSYEIQYGKTKPYGLAVPGEAIGNGRSAVYVSRPITGLEPETTYYYRIAASNAGGTTYGPEKTFSTGTPSFSFASSSGSAGTGFGQWERPMGMDADAEGNVYVADRLNNRIVKLNAKGEAVAQFGSLGSGPGAFNDPRAVTVGPDGNLWVADFGNSRIQKLTPSGGFILQIGPNEKINPNTPRLKGPNGVVAPGEGYVVVTDQTSQNVQVYYESPNGAGSYYAGKTFGGSSTTPNPTSIDGIPTREVTSGEAPALIAFTDYNVHKVFTFEIGYWTLSSFGTQGSGQGQLFNPYGVTVRGNGNILVSDRGNNRIQQFSRFGEFMTSFGGPGSGTGQFSEPSGLASSSRGVVFVSDAANKRIQRWTQPGPPGAVTLAATAVKGKSATLRAHVNPSGAATTYLFEGGSGKNSFTVPAEGVAAGSGFESSIVSQGVTGLTPELNPRVRVRATNANGTTYGPYIDLQLYPTWNFSSAIGSLGSGSTQFNAPRGMATDSSGNVWVADRLNNRIKKYSASGEFLASFGTKGTAPGQMTEPTGIALDESGNLWITEPPNKRIQKFKPDGTFLGYIGPNDNGGNLRMSFPTGIAVGPQGKLFVTDQYSHNVQVYNPTPNSGSGPNNFVRSYGDKAGEPALAGPTLIASWGPDLFFGDGTNNKIYKIVDDSELKVLFGTAGSGPGQISVPYAVAPTAAGNLLVAERGNDRVQLFNQSGGLITQFASAGSGPGQISQVGGLTLTQNGETLFLADGGNNRLQRWLME